MKIDLHIHTKKIYDSEPDSINIPNEQFFINCLEDNDVGVVAITNHNSFDIDQYSIIQNLNNNRILILPGVELDVKDRNGELKQVNLIVSDNSDLNSFVDNINLYLNSNQNVSDIIDIFKEDFLVYIDTKKSNRSWRKDEELEWFKEKLEKEGNKFIICDVNNAKSLQRYRARNYNTLIGSDVKDWTKYNESAKKLIDVNIQINSFEIFKRTFVYNDDETYRNLFNNLSSNVFKDFKIKLDEKKEINIGNIKIYDGINVIFGQKATGKTKIIESIRDKTKDKNIYYDSNDKKEIIDDFFELKKKEFEDSNYEYRQKREKIIKNFKKMYDFKDYKFNQWKKLFESYTPDETIKITNYFKYKNVIKPQINSVINVMNNTYETIKKMNDHLFGEIRNKYINQLNNLLFDSRKIYINEFKSFWRQELYKKIIEQINEYSIFSNGKNSSIMDIGLFKKWSIRNEIRNSIDELKRNDWEISANIKNNIDLFDRGKIDIKLICNSFNFKNIDINNCWIKGRKEILKQFKKIFNVDEEWLTIKKCIEDNEFKKFISELIEKPFYIQNKAINKNNIALQMSDGELAIVALNIILDVKDKEYYILNEPDTFLGSQVLFEFLIKKMQDISRSNKKVILTTHNPALAINSLPFNMIYRKRLSDTNYITYQGNVWINKFININDSNDVRDYKELLLEEFEYELKHFLFRKDSYEK